MPGQGSRSRYQTAADLRNELEDLKQDSAAVAPAPRRPRRVRVYALLAAAGGIVAASIGGWMLFGRAPLGPRGTDGFTIDRFTRLTTTGTASLAAISPDGRYVVHVKGDGEGFGLWIRQTATSSDVSIVPVGDARFDGLAFSPDGNYVLYNAYPASRGVATLYRVPVLGGSPTPLIEDVDSAVTFAPDQRRFAFMRSSATRGTTEIIIADSDGGNANALAAAKAPDRFNLDAPAWSPDGKTILATAGSPRPGVPSTLYAVDVDSGATRTVGEPWGMVRDVHWLPDGRSFLATGLDLSGLATTQIWQVAYPSGARSRVTNDLHMYLGLSVSGDGRSLATVQFETVANVYVADLAGRARRITSGTGRADGIHGIAWLPDGRVIHTSTATGLPQLWIVNSDGTEARQLTSDGPPPKLFPWSSPDGRWIYFSSHAKGGRALFRIAPDGSGLLQLTTDGDSFLSMVSADGKTLYLNASRFGAPRVMTVPAQGGTPQMLIDKHFRAHAISFDGSRLIGTSWSDERRSAELAILSLDSRQLQLLPGLPTNGLFMPDGSLGFIRRSQGKSMVVSQPLTGGGERALTPADEQFIFTWAVARDGRIAYSRGTSTSDVVLIRAK